MKIISHDKHEKPDYDSQPLMALDKSKAVTVRKNRDSSLDTKTGASQARWEREGDSGSSPESTGGSVTPVSAKEETVKPAGGGGGWFSSWRKGGSKGNTPLRLASELPELKPRAQSPMAGMVFTKLQQKQQSPELRRVMTVPETKPELAQMTSQQQQQQQQQQQHVDDWSDEESINTPSK